MKKSLLILGALLFLNFSDAAASNTRKPSFGEPSFFAELINWIVSIISQHTPPQPQPTSPPNGAPKESVPIDGGASLLLASGAAYGFKKLRDTRIRQS